MYFTGQTKTEWGSLSNSWRHGRRRYHHRSQVRLQQGRPRQRRREVSESIQVLMTEEEVDSLRKVDGDLKPEAVWYYRERTEAARSSKAAWSSPRACRLSPERAR
jgi:hypothetical protein